MSAPTSFNQNLSPIKDPTLKDLLDLYQKQTLLNLNCMHLGTIQSFDATQQTVQVSINYKKTSFQFNEVNFTNDPVLSDYPLTIEAPLVVLGGGLARITFPVAQGDQCLLLFNDRDIDNWFAGSLTSPNNTARLHSFADGIALIGPNNLSTIISDYDAVRALITNGTVKNGINPVTNKLTLTNGTSLNTLLQNLCTQLEDLTTALAVLTVTGVTPGPPSDLSGVPSNAATFVSIGAQITTIATDIGLLIE